MPKKYSYTREPLTRDETARLCSACETLKGRLLVYMLLDTGLRIQEYCNIKPADVDWQLKRIKVLGKNTIGKDLKNYDKHGGKKLRYVPLTRRCALLLQDHFVHYNDMQISPSWANRMVHAIANRAKITRPCSPHVLRHTFATHSLRFDNISLPALQKVLGHEDLQTTAIYLNVTFNDAVEEFTDKKGGYEQEEDYLRGFRK